MLASTLNNSDSDSRQVLQKLEKATITASISSRESGGLLNAAAIEPFYYLPNIHKLYISDVSTFAGEDSIRSLPRLRTSNVSHLALDYTFLSCKGQHPPLALKLPKDLISLSYHDAVRKKLIQREPFCSQSLYNLIHPYRNTLTYLDIQRTFIPGERYQSTSVGSLLRNLTHLKLLRIYPEFARLYGARNNGRYRIEHRLPPSLQTLILCDVENEGFYHGLRYQLTALASHAAKLLPHLELVLLQNKGGARRLTDVVPGYADAMNEVEQALTRARITFCFDDGSSHLKKNGPLQQWKQGQWKQFRPREGLLWQF